MEMQDENTVVASMGAATVTILDAGDELHHLCSDAVTYVQTGQRPFLKIQFGEGVADAFIEQGTIRTEDVAAVRLHSKTLQFPALKSSTAVCSLTFFPDVPGGIVIAQTYGELEPGNDHLPRRW